MRGREEECRGAGGEDEREGRGFHQHFSGCIGSLSST